MDTEMSVEDRLQEIEKLPEWSYYRDVADIAGVSETSLLQYTYRGVIEASKRNGRPCIHKEELARFVANKRHVGRPRKSGRAEAAAK